VSFICKCLRLQKTEMMLPYIYSLSNEARSAVFSADANPLDDGGANAPPIFLKKAGAY